MNGTFNNSAFTHTNSRGLVSNTGMRISTQVSSIQTASKTALAGQTLEVSAGPTDIKILRTEIQNSVSRIKKNCLTPSRPRQKTR